MDLLYDLDYWVMLGLKLLVIPVAGYAFVHALLQRSDAFTAADKLTKPAWLGISGGALFVLVVFWPWQGGPGDSHDGPSLGLMFWLAGVVAALVYIVDVKPAVVRVQGGGQRW